MLLNPTAVLQAIMNEIRRVELDPDQIAKTMAAMRAVDTEAEMSPKTFHQLAQICQLRQSYRKKQGELQTAIKELASCKMCVYLNGCLAACLSPLPGLEASLADVNAKLLVLDALFQAYVF